MTLTVATLSGCGGGNSDIATFEYTGTVTFENQPVPSGEISFTPDVEKGNAGPTAHSVINSGQYKVQAVSGPHVVTILGNSSSGSGATSEVEILFEPYETTIELPAESGTHDFDVPAK